MDRVLAVKWIENGQPILKIARPKGLFPIKNLLYPASVPVVPKRRVFRRKVGRSTKKDVLKHVLKYDVSVAVSNY